MHYRAGKDWFKQTLLPSGVGRYTVGNSSKIEKTERNEQNEKGKYIKYSIPFGDTYWLFGVKDSLGHNLYDLYKRGVKENLKNIESFDEWDSN